MTIAALAVVHLVGVIGKWWPTPDSALYLSLARSLAAGEGYQFNGEPSNVVGPGFPVMLAGIRLLPGAIGHGFVLPNLLVALCGLGVLWLVYVCVARLSDRRSALAVVLVMGLSYRFYQNSHRIISDMPTMLAVWAMLYAALRYQSGRWAWLVPAGAMATVAIAIRIPIALVVGPIAVGIALDRSAATRKGRRLIVAGVILLLAVAAWQGWMAMAARIAPDTPGYTLPFAGDGTIVGWLKVAFAACLNLIVSMPAAAHNLMESMAEYLTGQELIWPIGLPAVAMVVVGMVAAWRTGRRLAPTVIVLYLAGTVLATGEWAIRERYMLPCLPIFLLTMFEGVGAVVTWVGRLRRVANRPQARLVVISVLTAMFIAANAPRTLNWAFHYSYLSYTPRYYERIAGGDYRELLPACEVVADNCGDDGSVAVIGVNRSIVHFLSGCVVADELVENDKPLPLTTEANADRWLDHVSQPGGAGLLMVDLRDAELAFRERVQARLAEMTAAGRLSLVYEGLDYEIYRQAEPPGD